MESVEPSVGEVNQVLGRCARNMLKELVIHSQKKHILGTLQVFVLLPKLDFVLLKVEEPIVVEPKNGISTTSIYCYY